MKAEKQYTPDHLCMLASTPDDVNNLLLTQIKPELDRRRRLSEDQNARGSITKPHLFIILDTFSPFNALGQLPELDMLFQDAARFGVTVLCLVDDLKHEPAQVQSRLSVAPTNVVGYEEIRLGGQRSEGVTSDTVIPGFANRLHVLWPLCR